MVAIICLHFFVPRHKQQSIAAVSARKFRHLLFKSTGEENCMRTTVNKLGEETLHEHSTGSCATDLILL